MLIDAGGAAIRRRERTNQESATCPGVVTPHVFTPVTDGKTQPTVTVHVTETHDGEACDCIEKDMVLEVGDEVELTHVCHDGRVDKVTARVTAITRGRARGRRGPTGAGFRGRGLTGGGRGVMMIAMRDV